MSGRRLIGCAAVFTAAVFFALAGPAQAVEELRFALVIGNGNYENTAKLANPPNDAKLMAATLRTLGFDVIERVDADRGTILKALREFGDRLENAGDDGVGLFYYAGHGVQVNGVNYMIPVDAEIERESDMDIYAVPAKNVVGKMDFAGSRVNFVILDACRNNPFTRSFRSATRGLAVMDAPRGTLIAYATAPGDVAADGRGDNSPYTAALARAMTERGLAAEHVFRRARQSVMEATGDVQVPWEASSLTGDFYFSPKDVPATPTPGLVLEPLGAPSDDTFELVFWNSIKDSTDPEEYEAYQQKYPEGRFAALARNRIDKLRRPPEPKEPEPPDTLPPVELAALPPPEPKEPEPPDRLPEVEPVEGDYFAVKRSNVRVKPTTASDKIGMVNAGQELEILGKVRDRSWYLLGRDGEPYGYIYETLIAALSSPPPRSSVPSPPPRPESVRVFNVQPVVHQGIRQDGVTAMVLQRLSNVPASMVVSEPDKIAPGDTVVTTVITRLDAQVVPNPEYLVAQTVGRMFGRFGSAIAKNVPQQYAIFTANIVIMARDQKTGRIITEDGLAEQKVDARQANQRMLAQALARAAQEATERLFIRLIGGVPPDRTVTASETDRLVEPPSFNR